MRSLRVVATLVVTGAWVCAVSACASPGNPGPDAADALAETGIQDDGQGTDDAGGKDAFVEDADHEEYLCPCGTPCETDSECDDRDPCTADTCLAEYWGGSYCNHDEIYCDDGDPCTDDTCEPGGECSHRDNGWCDPWCECEENEVCDTTTGECREATCEDPGVLPHCPCSRDDDCAGLCIAGTCADTCVDSCPDPTERCSLVVVGGEPAYYCIPRFANLCLPCQADSDCRTAQGTDDDRCVALGDEGSFCGAFCSDALPCPDGTACQDVLTADGGTSAQCVPPRTACENTNAFGTCAGVLSCQEGGPACVGPVPAMEECNLVDDNCNGQTDEGFANTDGDALADCVDPDLDNDGILNPLDNCPLVYNPAQEDSDGDGVGDACP